MISMQKSVKIRPSLHLTSRKVSLKLQKSHYKNKIHLQCILFKKIGFTDLPTIEINDDD